MGVDFTKSTPYNFMNRVAVFVDAGYLFAQGAVALTGEPKYL